MSKDRKEKGWAEVSTERERAPRAEEIVEVHQLSRDYEEIRLIGGVVMAKTHWLLVRKRDGGTTRIPRQAPSPEALEEAGERDPYEEMFSSDGDRETAERQTSVHYWTNAIVMDLEDAKPAKASPPSKAEAKSGFKEFGSPAWTPVRAVRFPVSVARELKSIVGMNKGVELSHPEKGRKLHVKCDETAPPSNRYSVQAGDAAPLTKKQRKYLSWDIAKLSDPPTVEEARRDAEELKERNSSAGAKRLEDAVAKSDKELARGKKPADEPQVHDSMDDDEAEWEKEWGAADKKGKGKGKPAKDKRTNKRRKNETGKPKTKKGKAKSRKRRSGSK